MGKQNHVRENGSGVFKEPGGGGVNGKGEQRERGPGWTGRSRKTTQRVGLLEIGKCMLMPLGSRIQSSYH